VLSAFVLHLFPRRDHLYVCSLQGFVSDGNDNSTAANFHDDNISVDSLVMKLCYVNSRQLVRVTLTFTLQRAP